MQIEFYEQLEKYKNKVDSTQQIVYWITGECGGGSIAKLLAQKLINRYGYKNVYCYTFQALNTINCSNLSYGQRISNEPYKSVFNIYNDDNQILQIYTNNAKFYMYGINKHIPISNNSKYIKKWQESTGLKYEIVANKDYAKYFMEILAKDLNINEITAYRFSDEEISRIDKYINKLSETNDIEKFHILDLELDAYFKTLGGVGELYLKRFEDINDQKKYQDIIEKISRMIETKFVKSSQETIGMVQTVDTVRSDNPSGFDSEGITSKKGDDYDPRDGYPFTKYSDVDIEYDASNEATVHIKNFMYSNYTINSNGKDNVERDINYVKFWKDGTNNGKLSEYKIGDYSKHTVFTYEGSNSYYNRFVNLGGDSFVKIVDGIYTIHGRILAAFPTALKGENTSEFKKSTENMNRVKNYKFPNKWQNNKKGISSQKDGGDYNGKANITIGSNEIYKLVDCVFENKNKHQFVVPFIIMDAKKVHLLPNVNDINHYLGDGVTRGGMMSNLTDNRYGQVTEYIKKADPVRYEYNIITNRTDTNDEKLITRDNYNSSAYDTITYVDNNKPITYFSRDEERDVVNISPIEPLATGGSSNDIMRTIFGDYRDEDGNFVKDYRLISMRIYKDRGIFTFNGAELDIRIADNNGVPLNSLWYGEKDIIDRYTLDTYHTENYEDYFSNYSAEHDGKEYNIIVEY